MTFCDRFMPKPKFGINGSGMHVNMSLCKDGKNIFDDPDGELGLSKEAYWFIGGLMKHMKGMAAITNPLVNSYKRLVPGYEAPIYIAWSVTYASQKHFPSLLPAAQSDSGYHQVLPVSTPQVSNTDWLRNPDI